MPRFTFSDIAFNSKAKKRPTQEDCEHYVGLEHLDTGSLVVRRWGAESPPVGDKLVMRKGDVLFGKRRAYQRKVAIAPFDGIFSAHGMVLRPNERVVDPRFFPFFLRSDRFMGEAVRISVGGLSPTINWSDLSVLEFDLPDLSNQRAFADRFWTVYEAEEAYRHLLSSIDELVESQFVEMFGGNCVPVVSANTILHNLRNGVSPSSRGKVTGKVLTLSAITQGSFDPSAWKESQFEISPDADKRVSKTDYLICRGNGNKTLVGVGEFSSEDRPDLVFPDTIIAAQTTKDEVELPYLRAAWQQSFVRKQIEAKSRSTNGTYKINQDVISNIQLPLPPIGEQRKFSAFVAAADKSKFAVRQWLTKRVHWIRMLAKMAFG